MLFVYPVGIPLFRFLHHDALQVPQWRGKKRELKRKSDCCAWRAFDKRTWWFELVDCNAQIGGDLDARLVLSVRSAVAVWNVVVTIAHIDAHHSLSLSLSLCVKKLVVFVWDDWLLPQLDAVLA